MKSIKPGRGPSMMGGIGSIFAALFGVIWTIVALSSGAGIFALFGVCFIGLAIFQAVYNIRNATSENRYSEFDIVDSCEEEDPWNRRFGAERDARQCPEQSASSQPPEQTPPVDGAFRFCPYCGKPLGGDFRFCPHCGRELPE